VHKLISAALGLTVLFSVLTGCGDDTSADAAEQPATSSTASDGSEPSDDVGEPSEGSESGGDDLGDVDDVEPADGPLVKFKHFTLRLPKGYTVADQLVDGIWQADRQDQPIGIDQVSIGDIPSFGGTLEEGIAAMLKTSTSKLVHVKRYPDIDVSPGDEEITLYHVSADIKGGVTDGAVKEALGGFIEDEADKGVPYGVSITWTMPSSRTPQERLELLQSVLATWQWR